MAQAPGTKIRAGKGELVPAAPFLPQRFQVFPVGTAKQTRRSGKPVRYWTVRGRADGWDFLKRFTEPYTAAQAKAWADDLRAGFTRGWLFDPAAKRFLDPSSLSPTAEAETVFGFTEVFWNEYWPTHAPGTLGWVERALNRARAGLLRPERPEASQIDREAIAAYLTRCSLKIDPPPWHLWTDSELAGEAYLRRWSLPMRDVGWADLQELLQAHRTYERGGERLVTAQATEARWTAPLKQMWMLALARQVVDSNPFVGLKQLAPRRNADEDRLRADPDLILDLHEVLAMAGACAQLRPEARRFFGLVLVSAFCALRPAEAAGLTRDSVVEVNGQMWLVVGRTQRRAAKRFLRPGDDPVWGPLKGRSEDDVRRVPVVEWLADIVRIHLGLFVGPEPHASLFPSIRGGRLDYSMFGRDYWRPARAMLFPAPPAKGPAVGSVGWRRAKKRSEIRLHDLRHVGASYYLRSGVDFVQAMRWTGHRDLKTFLSVYQGILPNDEVTGTVRLEQYLSAELHRDGSVTGRLDRSEDRE
ncbi:MAG TPA: hypothetical protein VNF50_04400 [Acidimicrobiales bacterium]|nr:hypothetical protein [Acidimicrobiales bacterium]